MFPNSLYVLGSLLVAATVNGQYNVVTGVQTGVNQATGAVPFRRNIMEAMNDVPTWSLMCQALAAMQAAPETAADSWFQMAGIHGRPYIPWGNANQQLGAPLTGYCTHDSVLFCTWHRPYLIAMEQIINGHAQTIAATYTTSLRATYQNAANNLRLLYWDWGTYPAIPPIVSQQYVTITNPAGAQVSINNPFFQYTFQNVPLNTGKWAGLFPPTDPNDGYLANLNNTVRNPNYYGGPSNPNNVNSVLAQYNIANYTWTALAKSTTYNSFSTMQNSGTAIENVHGYIHNWIGGKYGHMTELSYSAFDPIFFLHHCNVDRLFALWQAAWPVAPYVTAANDPYGTYSIIQYSIDTATTPLEPFGVTSSSFHTSNDIRALAGQGYSYPEIMYWTQTAAVLQKNVTTQINNLYHGGSSSSMKLKRGEKLTSKRSFTSRIFSRRKIPKLQSNQHLTWTAAVQVSKLALEGATFNLVFFFGPPPDDPNEWSMCSNAVGKMALLPPVGAASRRASMPVVLSYDEIALDAALDRYGYGGGCEDDVDDVKAFLKKYFTWGVLLMNGTSVPASGMPSLKVVVQTEVVTTSDDVAVFPTFSDLTQYADVTRGKAGGC